MKHWQHHGEQKIYGTRSGKTYSQPESQIFPLGVDLNRYKQVHIRLSSWAEKNPLHAVYANAAASLVDV